MNYLEQLLTKIEDVEAREQFTGILAKAPMVSDWIMDPETRTKTEAIKSWAESEWNYEQGMSNLEYRQQQELAALQGRFEEANNRKDGMEINELNDFLGKYIKDNGLMTRTEHDAALKLKEDAFSSELNLVSTLASRVPYLNAKYQRDFGDVFDPDVFIKTANEKGFSRYGAEGLDKYYEEFTAEKRAEKTAADLEAKLAAARDEGRKAALQEAGMGQSGTMPTLDGSPEMGHFEARLKGMANKIDPTQSQVPSEVELGRGVGRHAAAIADARDRAALVN